METLFLRFLAHTQENEIDVETSVQWVLETEGAEANNCGTVKLNNVAELIQDRKVVILLPVEQFYIGQVAVQTKNKKQLQKAVPYALEDELTEDIENLHFALGDRTANREIAVAAISRAYLNHLIKILSNASIFPDIITADIYGLEHHPGQWTLCIHNGRVLTRTSAWNGFACELGDFNDFMQIAVSEQESPPDKLIVHSHPDEKIEEIIKLEHADLDDFWSPSVFVRGFTSDNCINLLQGEYAKADKAHKIIRPWKIAAALAVIWVAISILHTVIEYNRYTRHNDHLANEIEQTFKRAFPDVRKVVNARVQMEQRIKKLTSENTQNDSGSFLKFLHQAGYELYKDPSVSITDIQYKNSQLTLEVKAKDIQILETVKNKLISKEINAELQTAKTVDDFVLARMLVSE